MAVEYKEDWSQHNFDTALNNNDKQVNKEFMDNVGLDTDLFDEEQIEYLTEFLKDYRLEVCKTLTDFICRTELKGKTPKNVDALFVRIAGRAALLDDLLNNRETKINLWKSTYGTSLHQRYDCLYSMVEELKQFNPFIEKALERR